MFRGNGPGSAARAFGLAVSLVFGTGCQLEAPLKGFGVSLVPPVGWRAEPPGRWPVPGDPLAAWSWGPSSLVVHRALPIPGGTAEGVAEALANRLANLPGLQVEIKTTEAHAGQRFARVEVVAPGTGDALAPSGAGTPVAPEGRSLIPTRRITLGLVRPSDTLYLTWHAPESDRERLAEQVDLTLRRLQVEMPSPSSSAY